jgi:hypothetical protein
MKNRILLLICLLSGSAFGQKSEHKRHTGMIRFLLEHKQLVGIDTIDFHNIEGYIFDRLVIEMKHNKKSGKVYVFGSNSPHGKLYIALEDVKGLQFIESKDMAKDIPIINNFFKYNKATGIEITKALPVIADTYLKNRILYTSKIED